MFKCHAVRNIPSESCFSELGATQFITFTSHRKAVIHLKVEVVSFYNSPGKNLVFFYYDLSFKAENNWFKGSKRHYATAVLNYLIRLI